MPYDRLYLIVTGAGTARRVPALLSSLTGAFASTVTILTPNAMRVVSPRELALVPDHRLVDSYFDDVILPRPPDGVVLVAPCSFNSLNKLAGGIADTLALSVAAEAIGRQTPVVVAVSVNDPLAAHPRTGESIAALRSWGVDVLSPVEDERGYLTMADDATIVAATLRAAKR